MTRQYFYLTQINISYKNRYKRLINICFPELEKIFKSNRIYEETALNFVKAFPHAYIVKEKRVDALYNNLYISQMVVKLGDQCPSHPVYNYYLIKKAEGKHYYESLTACSTKILRMLYSMCKNNKQFLEE